MIGRIAPRMKRAKDAPAATHGELPELLGIDPELLARVAVERSDRVGREPLRDLSRLTGAETLLLVDECQLGALQFR